MLGRLYIQNFFFIRDVEVEFERGLNVITGETGTGKSMTISAIEFLMGKQGDYPEGTAVELELLGEEEIILRREVKKGRSRYYVNGKGASKSTVLELLEGKISLQGQNEFINLFREDFQRKLLDTFANLNDKVKELEKVYNSLRKKEQELFEFLRKKEELIQKKDYLEFRVREVEEIGISSEEYEELKNKANLINNLEKVKKAVGESLYKLLEGENSVYEILGEIRKNLAKVESYSGKFSELIEKIANLEEEVYELYNSLKEEMPEISEEEVNEINEKLFRIQRLEEKYKKSFPEILKEVEEIKEELSNLNSVDFKEEELREEVEKLREEYDKLAEEVSRDRRKKAEDLEERIEEILKELNLERAKLKVEIKESEPTKYGKDKIEFLFSSYGKDFKPLEEVASGGELSRLFLALSLILPASETYVFDEVDAGISGETSFKVAKFLKELSKKMQVIVITHSAPLCAAGDKNFKTEKKFLGDIPYIVVRELSEEEKVEEVARLMGMKSEKTLEGAKELVEAFK
ncbi:DNA repair protein RecN [Aquifex aeolicus]|uniref:DNA repair protein RecN n=1 Tax=Aquifex aeolicus (strain VF5) TaxID=224324 RepID=RECN_AQUAE|nr:DNA repair protein RecN [Aquifex aeolicus]O66834.1 RecName: Full=DNA repair protein RecN; AltName: Full=Recombination protein N [Aquifex aeolicus VF5]AAC06789.1 recombination protein RecN [Aquifex aeolicus VF5]